MSKILVTGGGGRVMKERWRNISGYEGLYQVSDLGRIKSLPRDISFIQYGIKTIKHIEGRIRSLGRGNKKGYQVVFLYKNNKGNPRLVHHLVLEAFKGPCPPKQECRHFPDKNATNNRLKNLQWGTRSQNNLDKRVHGTNGAKPLVLVRCENCGKESKTENWRSKTKRFCSQNCYHSYPRRDSHKNNISFGLKTAYTENRR